MGRWLSLFPGGTGSPVHNIDSVFKLSGVAFHTAATNGGLRVITFHEQHIRAASCRSRLESQWETPNFDPRGAKTSRGIELKIGRINYLGGLTKGAKFQICNPPGVVWAIG